MPYLYGPWISFYCSIYVLSNDISMVLIAGQLPGTLCNLVWSKFPSLRLPVTTYSCEKSLVEGGKGAFRAEMPRYKHQCCNQGLYASFLCILSTIF